MSSRSNSNDPLLLAACATAFATLIPPVLRQTGAIKHLPDPLANADRIVTSSEARPFGVPAAFLGLATFAATFGLALAARNSTLARRLLGGAVVLDGAVAAYDLTLEAVAFRQLSTWSLATAAATTIMIVAARKPALESLRIAAHDVTVLVDHI